MKGKLQAFTLIELLIVVAIIAILAAIAVPNFLEAQTRAKVSRVKNDERALATALEAYYIDNNHYPPSSAEPTGGGTGDVVDYILPLSTPIAYITTARYEDPFGNAESDNIGLEVGGKSIYFYVNSSEGDGNADAIIQTAFPLPDPRADKAYSRRWIVASAGPDRLFEVTILDPNAVLGFVAWVTESDVGLGVYDPTNGTLSRGDISRSVQGFLNGNN